MPSAAGHSCTDNSLPATVSMSATRRGSGGRRSSWLQPAIAVSVGAVTLALLAVAYRQYRKRNGRPDNKLDTAVAQISTAVGLTSTPSASAHYTAVSPSATATASVQLSDVTVASAPGKVLITGGYLVLERPNAGLVCSVDARFHAAVAALPPTLHSHYVTPSHRPTDDAVGSLTHAVPIIVYTPQRTSHPTIYELQFDGPGYKHSDLHLVQLNTDSVEFNPFVFNSLLYTLYAITAVLDEATLQAKLSTGLILHLHGDHQFYTADAVTDGNQQQQHLDGKTGLGSSAALTSALVTALFAHFGLVNSNREPLKVQKASVERTLNEAVQCSLHEASADSRATSISMSLSAADSLEFAHRTAQFVHCLAQGKVGSGFDVSAAFYGSQRYVRYSPAVLQPLIELATQKDETQPTLVDRTMLLAHLLPAVEQYRSSTPITASSQASVSCCLFAAASTACAWDHECQPLALPPGLSLVLADVKGGAKTPSMVKQVLQWKKQVDSTHDNPWQQLTALNTQVEQLLRQLQAEADSNSREYQRLLAELSRKPAAQWSHGVHGATQVSVLLQQLRTTFESVRQCLRQMGDASGAEIEPAMQTELCDSTMQLPGVLAAAVPGAGGDDAIYAIVLSDATLPQLNKLWSEFSTKHSRTVQRLHVQESKSGVSIRTHVDDHSFG